MDNIGFGNLKIYQSEDGFRYGVDAVILSHFASVFAADSKDILDLGTGNGIIPILLSYFIKNKQIQIQGIDFQEKCIDIARANAKLNKLEDIIAFENIDILDILNQKIGKFKDKKEQKLAVRIERNSKDLIVCNPPYFEKNSAIKNNNSNKYLSRHETTAGLEDFIVVSGCILKDRGHLCMVHRPSRLVDIIYFARKHGLEPKNIRFVCPKVGEEPNIVLIDCVKGAGKELKILESLYIYGDKQEYSNEIIEIYEKNL